MTPLNADEKRGIVEAYKALVNAIRKDAPRVRGFPVDISGEFSGVRGHVP
jgi:hypothetical protein